MISKKTKYALMALGYLAEHSDGEPILISEIASRGNIPRKFLEGILLALRKGGVLNSKIGKGGGYMLSLPPKEITVGRVMCILEGGFTLVECIKDVNPRTKCRECGDSEFCGIRLVMIDVKKAVDSVLEVTTLADIVNKSKKARQKKL